jgi:Ase1/PRC1/MAP65 family protein
MFLI